jgi:hypothetical protein
MHSERSGVCTGFESASRKSPFAEDDDDLGGKTRALRMF